MQLQRAVVMFNSYDFPQEEIPPKTFGGQISFAGGIGSMTIQMKPETVTAILDLIAEDISQAAKDMAKDITPAVVRSGGLAIEHKPEVLF